MGDGIMALFGAPLAHEDHAVRACYAALRIRESVRKYADQLQSQGFDVQIRVGLNSGEVVVRSIGSDLRMDYSAVGQTTHLAARMEQTAAPGTIRLTTATHRLTAGLVQVRSLGPVGVKGLTEPLEALELIGPEPTMTRLEASAGSGLTPLVGRETELALLHQIVDRTERSAGQVAALVGEAGIGKSRLVWELSRSPRLRNWLSLTGRSQSYSTGTPYVPVVEILKAYFRLEAHDDAAAIRSKVTEKLLSRDPTLALAVVPVLALLDVPSGDEEWRTLDPLARQQRTIEAIKQIFLQESREQPLLLVVEDLHWVDAATQQFLGRLVSAFPTARIMLLVTSRPGHEHDFDERTYYTPLHLHPLAPTSADDLLLALFGNDASLEPVKHALIERTQGNPFFLEESVQALAEVGVLIGPRGACRLAREVEAIDVPPSVQALLAARVDRLASSDKQLLQAAAVIGKDVRVGLLRQIADVTEQELQSRLASLQAGEFLYETHSFPELEYTFKHVLTQEVVYAGLLRERRRALHARIVEAIEQLYADRLLEHVAQLAHHAVQAEEWSKAVTFLRQSGHRAFERSMYRAAVAAWDGALHCLEHLPRERQWQEIAIDIRFHLRDGLWPLAAHNRAVERLQEAIVIAEALGDERRLSRAYSLLAFFAFGMGRIDRGEELARRAVTIANSLGDLVLRTVAHWPLVVGSYEIGDYRRSIDFARQIIEAVQSGSRDDGLGTVVPLAVNARVLLSWSLAELGDFADAAAAASEALTIAEALDQPVSRILASFSLGPLRVLQADLPAAAAVLERGLDVCRRYDVAMLFPMVALNLAPVYAVTGRIAESVALLEQATASEASGAAVGRVLMTDLLASEAYLTAARLDQAETFAHRAVEAARRLGRRGCKAWALRVISDVAAERRDVVTAEDQYRQSLTLAAELGMRPLVAHCHRGLGKLYRRTGKREQAQEHLTTATTMYREMGMTYWLEKVQAEFERA
jgi:tetratricopeptide (TPR) repeat protein